MRSVLARPGRPLHFHGHNDSGLASAVRPQRSPGAAGSTDGERHAAELAGNAEPPRSPRAPSAVGRDRAQLSARDVSALAQALSGRASSRGSRSSARTSSPGSRGGRQPVPRPLGDRALRRRPGRKQTLIVLGKKSGIDNIRIKCEELELDLLEDAQRELLRQVKASWTERRGK